MTPDFHSRHPSIHLSVCLSVCLSVHSSIHLSVCLSISLSVCLSVHSSVHLSVCLFWCVWSIRHFNLNETSGLLVPSVYHLHVLHATCHLSLVTPPAPPAPPSCPTFLHPIPFSVPTQALSSLALPPTRQQRDVFKPRTHFNASLQSILGHHCVGAPPIPCTSFFEIAKVKCFSSLK